MWTSTSMRAEALWDLRSTHLEIAKVKKTIKAGLLLNSGPIRCHHDLLQIPSGFIIIFKCSFSR